LIELSEEWKNQHDSTKQNQIDVLLKWLKWTTMMPRWFDDFIVGVVDHVYELATFSKIIVNNRWWMAMVDEMIPISHNQRW
jgi:hypothetical protein